MNEQPVPTQHAAPERPNPTQIADETCAFIENCLERPDPHDRMEMRAVVSFLRLLAIIAEEEQRQSIALETLAATVLESGGSKLDAHFPVVEERINPKEMWGV